MKKLNQRGAGMKPNDLFWFSIALFCGYLTVYIIGLYFYWWSL